MWRCARASRVRSNLQPHHVAVTLHRRLPGPNAAVAPVRHLCAAPPGSSTAGAEGDKTPVRTGLAGLIERGRNAMDPKKNKAQAKVLREQQRGAGWREALRTGMYEQQKLKREHLLREQLESMSMIEKFSFDDFTALVEKMLDELESGMTMATRARLKMDKVQGGKQEENLEENKQSALRKLQIIKELTPSEKRWPKLLDRAARNAIAAKLDVEPKHVDELLLEYQMQYAQWTFLRREFLRGRPVPQSNEELEWMIKIKPTREFVQLMKAYEQKRKELEDERNGVQVSKRRMGGRPV